MALHPFCEGCTDRDVKRGGNLPWIFLTPSSRRFPEFRGGGKPLSSTRNLQTSTMPKEFKAFSLFVLKQPKHFPLISVSKASCCPLFVKSNDASKRRQGTPTKEVDRQGQEAAQGDPKKRGT